MKWTRCVSEVDLKKRKCTQLWECSFTYTKAFFKLQLILMKNLASIIWIIISDHIYDLCRISFCDKKPVTFGTKLSCLWCSRDPYLCEHALNLSFETAKLQDIMISFKSIYDKLDFLMARFMVKHNYIIYKPHFYNPPQIFWV